MKEYSYMLIHARTQKFCQRGSNFDNDFSAFLGVFFSGERDRESKQIPL